MATEDLSLSQDLTDLILTLGLQKPVLVGVSLGAATAVEHTLNHPDEVCALVLVPSRFLSPHPVEGMEGDEAAIDTALEEGDIPRAAELEYQDWIVGERQPEEVRPKVREMGLQMLEDFYRLHAGVEDPDVIFTDPPAKDRLHEIGVPSLVIVGDRDKKELQTAAQWMAQTLPAGRLVPIPCAGHLPNMDDPDLFNRTVLEFLAEALG